jgi:hypothetical protein
MPNDPWTNLDSVLATAQRACRSSPGSAAGKPGAGGERKPFFMGAVMVLISKICAAWIQAGEHCLKYPYSRSRTYTANGVAIKEALHGVGRDAESHSPCHQWLPLACWSYGAPPLDYIEPLRLSERPATKRFGVCHVCTACFVFSAMSSSRLD